MPKVVTLVDDDSITPAAMVALKVCMRLAANCTMWNALKYSISAQEYCRIDYCLLPFFSPPETILASISGSLSLCLI